MFISQGDPEEPPHAYGTHLALDIQRIVYIIMYINDLPDYLEHCDVTLYADDTVLFISDKSLHNMKSYMNSDMEKLTNWLKLNHLTLNLNS